MSNKKFHLHLQLHAISRLSRFIVAALAFSACTDEQFSELPRGGADPGGDGIGFSITVAEQADLIYDYGRTRAAGGDTALDSTTMEANTFVAHELQGGEAWELSVHRMPLPIMGIHPRTITSPSTPADTSTGSVSDPWDAAMQPVSTSRASLEDIVGSDLRTFHDSMTVWGYTYIPTYIPTTGQAGYDSKRDELCYQRVLYDQILVKKIRGWRNSVHWPYDLDFYKTAGFTPAEKPNKMRFYAYAPSLENLDITLKNAPSCSVAPIIQFIVPDNPADQRDLLYGYSSEIDVQTGPTPGSGGGGAGHYEGSGTTEKEQHLGDDDKTVPLTFRHILTAVRFAQGNMPVGFKVKKIQLHGIPNQGTYDPAADGGNGAWSAQTGSKTYAVSADYTVAAYAANTYIDGGNVLLLLPGTMTAAQTMEITLNDGSRDHTLTCSLAGDIWLPGYTVTYKITIGEVQGDYYLLLDAGTTPVDVPAEGATGTETKYKLDSRSHEQTAARSGSFTIHSYRNYKNYSTDASGVNSHHAVEWQLVGFATLSDDESTYQTATYTLDKDAAPGSWITSFDGWNRSGETATEQDGGGSITVSYALAEQQKVYTGNHAATLYNNNIGAESVVDLSSSRLIGNGTPKKVPQTTANCYIVNSVGTYSFPPVYGNGIEGGTVKDASSLNPSGIFRDHEGRLIQNAYIIKQVNHKEEAWDNTYTDPDGLGRRKKVWTYVSYNYKENHLSAEVLWIDNNHSTVTSPSISGSGGDYSVQFTVQAYEEGGQHYLPPCNAVIALKGKRTTYKTYQIYESDETTSVGGEYEEEPVSTSDSPEILWTWHIWVTDEVLSNNNTNTDDTKYPSYYGTSRIVALENHGGTTRNILPVNLGWVPDEMAWGIYKPREVWVKIKQVPAESDQVIYLKLRLEAQQDKVTGTSTVYQWGRPTALPMVKKMDGNTRPIYNAARTEITSSFQKQTATPDNLPAQWNSLMVDGTYADRWWHDAADNAYWSATAKTLYDPCPPGYQLPPSAVFSGMTLSSLEAELIGSPLTALNAWSNAVEEQKGAFFYAKKHTATPEAADRYKAQYYIPATSYFDASEAGPALSDLFDDGHRAWGRFWTSDKDGTQGRIIQIDTQYKKVSREKVPFVDAMPVRPMSTN